MNRDKILYIIGTTLVITGCLFIVAAFLFSKLGYSNLADILLGFSSILGFVSLIVLIIRLVLMSKTTSQPFSANDKVSVKIVDVKDIPKSKEEKLFEQYEDLFKKNLISKEDLELKRKELLNK